MKTNQVVIEIEELKKAFSIRRSQPGILGALRSLFTKLTTQEAIQGINLKVYHGERIAFIGPNGAGKSTTIKILTGILYPTSGRVKVLGYTPWEERKKLSYHIGSVFGQRSQLWYHLPASDTFELLSKIYELDPINFKSQLNRLVEIFDIEAFLDKPVRKLSLGQRMRCEIVASLLHNPKILFLDEPTIGLDVNAKLKIRAILNQMSKEFGTTLFLTSHDTADIEQICDRVVILDEGKILKDGSLNELKREFSHKKTVTLITEAKNFNLNMKGVQVIESEEFRLVCQIDLREVSMDQVIRETLNHTSLKDVTIQDPSMEEIIRALYAK
ncbi:MAG: ATP-binding cassette domain-containing protein [Chlamydiae bacterium]|nr:ATP-binding cassette domain-containing protein [Chlamydiota bacterium]